MTEQDVVERLLELALIGAIPVSSAALWLYLKGPSRAAYALSVATNFGVLALWSALTRWGVLPDLGLLPVSGWWTLVFFAFPAFFYDHKMKKR